MATSKFTLKLWIDKKANRVVFAEASKDFVDFLFSLLTLPVGSVIKLLTKTKMLGCIANVYESVENLSNTYVLQPDVSKTILLNPKVAVASSLHVPVLTANEVVVSRTYYSCPRNGNHPSIVYFTSEPSSYCPHYLGCSMSTKATYHVRSSSNTAAISNAQNGYVKEAVSYMVMDDLSVMPLSTVSLTTLLNKSSVENLNSLEERVVTMGMEESLELLRLTLHSKTALSEVFLVKKEKK